MCVRLDMQGSNQTFEDKAEVVSPGSPTQEDDYLSKPNVRSLLQDMMETLQREQPRDIVAFLLEWLQKRRFDASPPPVPTMTSYFTEIMAASPQV